MIAALEPLHRIDGSAQRKARARRIETGGGCLVTILR
jgi:hypothetical protein